MFSTAARLEIIYRATMQVIKIITPRRLECYPTHVPHIAWRHGCTSNSSNIGHLHLSHTGIGLDASGIVLWLTGNKQIHSDE